jgi:anhydro-N-acetylmuramic acid kinase
MTTYQVIGLMSGTSLDGVDIANCIFNLNDGKWKFEIKVAETIRIAPSSKRFAICQH